MRTRIALLAAFLPLLAIGISGQHAAPNSSVPAQASALSARAAGPHPNAVPPAIATKTAALRNFGKMPVYFVPNRGQIDGPVAFYIKSKYKTVYFTPDGVTFALRYDADSGSAEDSGRWSVKTEFLGARPDAVPVGVEETGTRVSYFKGKPADWHAGLPAYSTIAYRDLWPGIDLVYTGDFDKLKYEFIVHPDADPAAIRMALRGAERAAIDKAGRLAIKTPAGGFEDETPLGYQEGPGGRSVVPTAFHLNESNAADGGRADAPGSRTYAYGFDVGPYDRTRDLVLDPSMLAYCGYIGGSDTDFAHGIAVDAAGCAYVTGETWSDASSFPVAVGPDVAFVGQCEAFVAKVKADGSGLVYCGYIGGDSDTEGYGVAVDGSGCAYVTGVTVCDESAFPVLVGPTLIYGDGWDGFVAKVKADGTGLVYCGYIGGGDEDWAQAIAVDGSGNAYVAGFTASDEDSFPVTVGPGLTFKGGSYYLYPWDAFVAKVKADGTGFAYCGYIAGSSDDYATGIALDGAGHAYVTGYTASTENSFPVAVGPDLTANGNYDAFVAKVKADGTGLDYCGYIGGSDNDRGNGIAVDASGYAYVTGAVGWSAGGGDMGADLGSGHSWGRIRPSWVGNPGVSLFPVLVGPGLTSGGGTDAFAAKVKADGSGLVYCGYIGGADFDAGYGIAVDGEGCAYVAGTTSSDETTFPVKAGPGLVFQGVSDAFVAEVKADGTGLVYCGYIGGSNADQAKGVAVDSSGNAYVAGATNSGETTFPAAVGPGLVFRGGDYDAFVAKILPSGAASGFSLTVAAGTGGTTNPAPGVDSYAASTLVSVQAIPSSGYRFDKWTGDVPAGQTTNANITLTMDADKSVTATFKKTWTLTMYSATGGTTSPLPGAYTYDDGTLVSIQATSDSSYRFDHWTIVNGGVIVIDGGVPKPAKTTPSYVPDTDNPLSLTMDADKSVTPVFVRQYTLTIAAGTGGTTNPVPGTYTYDAGAVVSIQSTASTGYKFSGWSGDASGMTNPISVTMTSNKSVAANFIRQYTLTITAGTGGTTNPVPGTYIYDDGQSVSIQATASTGYRFGAWSGDASGTMNPISVTMNGDKAVKANFIRQYTLTITAGFGGTTSPLPGVYIYDEGTSVSVQAVPITAYQFDGWTGDASGAPNPVTIVMNGNKSVLANFSKVVKPPLVLTAVKEVNRSLALIEYVAQLTWQANPVNTGISGYRIYRIDNGQATLIAQVGAGTLQYLVRNLQASVSYQFGVTAVNGQGWESDMALITAQ